VDRRLSQGWQAARSPQHRGLLHTRDGQLKRRNRARSEWITGLCPGTSAREEVPLSAHIIPRHEAGLEPTYLVDELIPSTGIVLIWGKQKTYKSFWLLDLLLHVSLNWAYRDYAVRQGSVIYCAFEGGHGFKGRIEALRRHYGISPDTNVPLFVMPGQADLIKDHKTLIADFREQLGDAQPAVIVLDTLNRSLKGSESSDQDMTAYTAAAEALRMAFGGVVIIVHHCGYDDTHARGHTSLPAAADAELAVARDEGSPLMAVTVKHMRDGPEGITVRSRVQVVPLDPDQNGKPRASLVVVPDDTPGPVDPSRRGGRADNATPVLLDAMRKAVATKGEQYHPEGKMPVRAVAEDYVRTAFYKKYIDGEADKTKSASAQRGAFARALKKLLAEKFLFGEKDGDGNSMLWLASAEENYR
jgi:AAA domain